VGMRYQLTWKTLPGLRGLGCSEFRALPVGGLEGAATAHAGTVIVEFADAAERAAFLAHLEEHFAAQRFSNAAAAFEAVKSYVLEWMAQRPGWLGETGA